MKATRALEIQLKAADITVEEIIKYPFAKLTPDCLFDDMFEAVGGVVINTLNFAPDIAEAIIMGGASPLTAGRYALKREGY